MRETGPSETQKVLVKYAFCCPGSVLYCDCVNKNHGTAVMGENEAGEDYPIVDLAPQSRAEPIDESGQSSGFTPT